MKKYKALSRIFLLSYLIVVFSAVLFAFLLVKFSTPLAIVFIFLAAADLAAFIVARVMFEKHYNIFFYISIAALGYLNLAILGGFILEFVYTLQGTPAPYAWMISIAGILLIAVVDTFYILSLRKIHHKKMVELGLETPETEEEI